ncbi:hypothetical protein Dda_8981 [Drechslerella dactyloides]|uniref:Uncharacterized protein n=1 Tax=Drechslerella dactyloides TaxID=74499 RepID=A0AAD6IPY5_DREDA|nr:hypothetical protein Dda_8981 [Drechslerella dactyloides]
MLVYTTNEYLFDRASTPTSSTSSDDVSSFSGSESTRFLIPPVVKLKSPPRFNFNFNFNFKFPRIPNFKFPTIKFKKFQIDKTPKNGRFWVFRVPRAENQKLIPLRLVVDMGGFLIAQEGDYMDIVVPRKFAAEFQEEFQGGRLLRTDFAAFRHRSWGELLCHCLYDLEDAD